jgi:hypothetical protein
MDWMEKLTPEERQDWDDFVYHARADAMKKIDESALVMSLVPDKPDIKFAVELGLAIMLDKPIVAVAQPGIRVPAGLRRVAHCVIEMGDDFDTEVGRKELASRMTQILEELGLR